MKTEIKEIAKTMTFEEMKATLGTLLTDVLSETELRKIYDDVYLEGCRSGYMKAFEPPSYVWKEFKTYGEFCEFAKLKGMKVGMAEYFFYCCGYERGLGSGVRAARSAFLTVIKSCWSKSRLANKIAKTIERFMFKGIND